MRFLIVGCGSIGKKHIRNFRSLGHQVSGCEKDPLSAKGVSKAYGIEVFRSLEEAFTKKYDGAVICTPTSTHIPISLELARKGIHLLIEKPLSNNLKGITELSKIVKKKRLVVLVACNTRFLPSFNFAKGLIESGKIGKVLSVRAECGFYLPYWHPYEDYTKGYSANKHLGGGVILDDIHEIDALCWLFGGVKEVFCFAERLSNLRINTEDIAEIFLRFKSGTVAQIHLDYLQETYRRYYEFIGERGVIVWDFIAQSVRSYTRGTKQWKERVFHKELRTKNEAMFINEIKHFINCIKGKVRSINDVSSARECLKVALACHKSAKMKEVVFL